MKIITYELKNSSPYNGYFLISGQAYESIKDKLNREVWDLENYNTQDKKHIIEVPYGYKKLYSEVIVEEISVLIKEGFELTPKAQEQFEYWQNVNKENLEKRERIEQLEKEKRQERIEQLENQKQEQTKYDYILWCGKYDCSITQEFCNKCRRSLSYCRPALMKVKVK